MSIGYTCLHEPEAAIWRCLYHIASVLNSCGRTVADDVSFVLCSCLGAGLALVYVI